jgi:hypothetical protein
MRDYTETDATVASNSGAALEADANEHDGKVLRDADYASLTRRAATDSSKALVDAVLHLIGTAPRRHASRQSNASLVIYW